MGFLWGFAKQAAQVRARAIVVFSGKKHQILDQKSGFLARLIYVSLCPVFVGFCVCVSLPLLECATFHSGLSVYFRVFGGFGFSCGRFRAVGGGACGCISYFRHTELSSVSFIFKVEPRKERFHRAGGGKQNH